RRDDADGEHRFVVLAAGMNDLLRPALYGAHHRIEPLSPRDGPRTPADVVGPVCESSDRFAAALSLPPLGTGDLVAIRGAGASGAGMSWSYNGRPRLAELVLERGARRVARAAGTPGAAPETGEGPLPWGDARLQVPLEVEDRSTAP